MSQSNNLRAPVVITGANGHLGTRLIQVLRGTVAIRALVRSESAARKIRTAFPDESVEVRIVDYLDATGMQAALEDAAAVVHLVGIIKETAENTYAQAHQGTCAVLAQQIGARKDLRVIYLSILGSIAGSDNACLRSKGEAEDLLLRAGTSVLVLQVPMVLGENDFASHALKKRALATHAFTFRADSREQPIYAGDVVNAIVAGLRTGEGRVALAGPESLSRRALIERASALLNRHTRVHSLPLTLGRLLAGVLELLSKNPPVTRAMLDVLDHDDVVDAEAGARQLGISLTSLDETLKRVLQLP